MSITLILVFISVIVFLCFIYKSSEHYKKYGKFYAKPTPFYIPILGNAYLFFGKNILTAAQMITNTWGKSCVIYIPHRTYVTSDPQEIQIILNQAMDKSREYSHMQEAFGTSLLLVQASKWRTNRKLLSKGFKQSQLDTYVPTFNKKTNILIDRLRRNDYNDIFELFEQLTLDIFIEANTGVKCSILIDNDHSVPNIITEAQRLVFNRVGNLLKMNDFIFFLTPEGKRVKKLISDGYDVFRRIYHERREELNDEIILDSKDLTFLDLMVNTAEKEKLSFDYIGNESVLFASAATDTTAYSLAYILCLLAMHPKIQQRVYEEVMEVTGEAEITSDHLVKLKYTEMAINEAQRLLPVIPMVGRQTHEDLDVGSCVIPKDTGFIISILNLHRDENIYPDPLKYDPDRFLPENVAKRHPYSFIPFSGGPRNCIGLKYAQMSLKVSTASIIRSFELTTPYKSVLDLTFESSVVMNTTHPLEIKFIPRDK